MDGLESAGQVLVVGATNRPGSIDPAMLRPGRLGIHIEIGLPDRAEREAILKVHLAGLPLDADVDASELANLTEGQSGAGLMAICQGAARAALSRHLATGQAQRVCQLDLRRAARGMAGE